jgi:hypothetical protein
MPMKIKILRAVKISIKSQRRFDWRYLLIKATDVILEFFIFAQLPETVVLNHLAFVE